jgi:hypothetical protein
VPLDPVLADVVNVVQQTMIVECYSNFMLHLPYDVVLELSDSIRLRRYVYLWVASQLRFCELLLPTKPHRIILKSGHFKSNRNIELLGETKRNEAESIRLLQNSILKTRGHFQLFIMHKLYHGLTHSVHSACYSHPNWTMYVYIYMYVSNLLMSKTKVRH